MEHEPDPEFARHLEWQIRSALRRQDRFAQPVRSSGLRRVGVAALVLLSLSVGAGGVVAAEHMQSAEERAQQQRQREILQRRTQIEREVAESRLKHAEMEMERLKLLLENKVVSKGEYDRASAETENARREVRRLTIDLDEIASTGVAPRDDLVAPRVNGRDFVTERLQLEVSRMQGTLEALEREHQRTLLLAEQKLIGDLEVFTARAEISQVRTELTILRKKLEVRNGWIFGEISDDHVDLLVMQVELQMRIQAQRTRVEVLERRVEHMHRMVENKVAQRDYALESELTEARSMIELYQLELEVVENQLDGDERREEQLFELGYWER